MGHVTHHAIVITCFDGEKLESAYNFSLSLQCSVSAPIESKVNSYWSFAIFPDGSESGWSESERGYEQRKAMKEWLRSQQYEDGSSPFEWCEVAYGSADGNAVVRYHAWKKEKEVST